MEALTFMWLLFVAGLAFAAICDGKLHPYHTARRFVWLGIIAFVVFGFAFGIAQG